MSDASVNNLNGRPQLRRDLNSVVVQGRRRAYRIVIDEVSGQFTRVAEHVWRALHRSEQDPSLWEEARAAGWTRQRNPTQRVKFSPLYFRVPLGTIDSIAVRLSPLSGVLFSIPAMIAWASVIAIATVLAIGRSSEWMGSLGTLQTFLTQSNPIWLGVLFIITKCAHELAHAVMCRRMGSRCGRVGILFLCGVPCPYCDVTDIWRQPSGTKRAAVMLAGIYVELIIAALATFVWLGASDPALRLHALNMMVICGVSTILFNANPLMRYDGYYVLADLIGTVNLRQEAKRAFRSCVVARIAGEQYDQASRSDARSVALASYHAASTIYRLVMMFAIAALLIGIATWLQLRPLAICVVALAAIAGLFRFSRSFVRIASGAESWNRVPTRRRVSLSILGIALLLGALFFPLPRFRSAEGDIDLANAATVFLSSDGIVDSVAADVGDQVQAGDVLLQLHNENLAIEHAKLRGQLRVATLRSQLSRRVALDHADRAEQWKTLQANEEAVAARLASVNKRVQQSQVLAPESGIILPPPIDPSESRLGSLRDQAGRAIVRHKPWCRISLDGSLHAVLIIDARDRSQIDVGAKVRLCLAESPEKVISSTVVSVSAIEEDKPNVTRRAAYQVLCPLPVVGPDEVLSWIGKDCRGVFHLPNRTLASDLTHWLREWLSG